MQPHTLDSQRRRIPELDSIRGIAALAVCAHHIAFFWADIGKVQGIELKALRALIMWGHPAVLVFFALSGFVLFISHRPDNPKPYGDYLVGRIFRIYPAYLTVYASIIVLTVLAPFSADGWSTSWAGSVRPLADLSAASILRTLSLVFAVKGDVGFNVVGWSLVHEMRFSLLFPAMALLLFRHPQWFIFTSIAAYLLSLAILPSLGLKPDYLIADGLEADIFVTLHYLACFAAGMLTAFVLMRHRGMQVPTVAAIAFFALSLAVPRYIHDDFVLSLWGCALITVGVANARVASVLRMRPIRYLGSISYSLYLVHVPVSWLLFFSLHDRLPLAAVAIFCLIASLAVAALLERFVEQSGVRLGKRLLVPNRTHKVEMLA